MTLSRLHAPIPRCLPVVPGLLILQPGCVHDDTLTICVNPALPPMASVAGADASTMTGWILTGRGCWPVTGMPAWS
ncbi:hypothetical protein CFR76_02260 [Komagataeibacter swingsii]|uniref:Uncharacterized protein n=2 Tax=Komagataeibacter swingsii TaxID=215220 RepID=A0A2V4SFP7_9PROT|nr:hypothetical protein CFR76_02260 [Komagataeibacter swingsii]